MRFLLTWLGLGSFLLGGCQEADPFVPVTGKVLLNGEVLATGTVVFHAEDTRGTQSNHEPRGKIEQGRYRMTTAGRSGVLPGAYRVTVLVRAPASGTNPYAAPVWLVSPVYLSPQSTPLRVEVTANPASGAYDLQLLP